MKSATQSAIITIKTANLLWHRIIFITPMLFLAFTALLVLLINSSPILFVFFLFLMVICGFGCYLLANYLTKSDTTISFDHDLLTIEQANNKLKKDNLRQCDLASIRGYEIFETKNERALIIYLNDQTYYKYPLFKIAEALELKVFLNEKIIELSSKSNPNFKNFWAAFSFGLYRAFIFTILNISILSITIFFTGPLQWPFKLSIYILILIISIITWVFLVRIPAIKKNIRYGGFTSKNLIFLASALLLILPIGLSFIKLKEQPITTSVVNEILNYPKQKLFYIQNTSFDPKHTLLYRPIKKTQRKERKGNKFSVQHIFATPITSSNKKESIQVAHFWISKTYMQRIPKAIPAESKEFMIKEFSIQSRNNLIFELQRKPKFYTVLYSNLNETKNNNAVYELINSNRFSNSTLVILEPHWETIDAYKKELKLIIFSLVLIMIVLNIIAAVIIAVNR